MSDLPQFVEIREEGPREGFQIEKQVFPLAQRAAFIDLLSESGLKHIQIGAMVNPKKVPTMADTPELAARINKRDDVDYTVLWLNAKGFERTRAIPGIALDGALYFYASEGLAQANNDRSADQMRLEQLDFVKMYEAHDIPISNAYIMCAFGSNFDGPADIGGVTRLLPWIREITVGRGHSLPAICLADTMGWANPEQVKRFVGKVREIESEARIGLHIHDTRGLGIANVYAALQMGVDLFDSSVAGLGGCPFAGNKHARSAGNVCTEDMVFLCEELGIGTGVDLEALCEAARFVEDMTGETLTGRVMHSGSLARFRA